MFIVNLPNSSWCLQSNILITIYAGDVSVFYTAFVAAVVAVGETFESVVFISSASISCSISSFT
jgi:hypothetical protein